MPTGRIYALLQHPLGIPVIATQAQAGISDDRGETWTETFVNLYGSQTLYSSTLCGKRNGGTAALWVVGEVEPFSLWAASCNSPTGNFTNPVKVFDISPGGDPNPIWYLFERPDGRLLASDFRDTWIESTTAGKSWTITAVDPIFEYPTYLYAAGTVLIHGGCAAAGVKQVAGPTPGPGEPQEYTYSLWFRSSRDRIAWTDPLFVTDLTQQEPWHVNQNPDGRLVLSNGRDRVFESTDAGRNWIEFVNP